MSSTFFDNSKEIANDFLQSIVFIDDKAYPEKDEKRDNNELNAQQISKVFASSRKICAVYKPTKLKDIDELAVLSKKSDIVVIDWQINLVKNDNQVTTVENDDDDDDVQEHRGLHTRKIIKEIVSDSTSGKGNLKLILIYTGELILPNITDTIFDDLNGLKIDNVNKENCCVTSDNIKILIIAKPSAIEDGEEEVKFKYNPDLKNKIISYNNLPDFILTEFTKMTNGLLTNFALISLTEIRKNSGKLLSLFSKDLDSAYLSHQSLLPNSEDANELLVELIKDAFGNLLSYNDVNKKIDKDLVNKWLESFINSEDKFVLNGDGIPLSQKFMRDVKFLDSLLHSEENNVEKRYAGVFNDKIKNKKNRDKYIKYLSKNNTSLFLNNSQESLEEDINLNFAKLTHHKSLYISNDVEPKLTLGTVLRSKRDTNKFYLCIQQKCDSVRLYDLERKFLFVPLNISKNGKFQLVTSENLKLSIDKKSFSIRTIKFKGDKNNGLVKGVAQPDGSFLFTQKYTEKDDEQFSWELDLKDLHAQRIVDEYASQLSRVGLDESEWLRRWST